MKRFLCVIVIIMMVCGCSNNSNQNSLKNENYMIDTETVFQMLEDTNTYIIDVREDYEYVTGHLPNSYNIPVNQITEETVNFIPKNSKVIVYCQSGNRSKLARNILSNLGFTVYDMGGISNWNYEIITE